MAFTFLCLLGYTQYFNTGQDPASIKWKQIDTDNFRIVFPEKSEITARYFANLFETLLKEKIKKQGKPTKKFTVVLHTHSAKSNGMVAWAPKRMELFPSFSQNNDAQIWLDHLAIHEFRHVEQLDRLEHGFTRFLNYILGQHATVLVSALYLPPWFLEGDAVCAETALSYSGRGRLPVFEQEMRALLLEKGAFSYDKAVNGSYKDFMPDRYKLGYYLVAKGRINYGKDLWNKTLNYVAEKPYGLTSFASEIGRNMMGKRRKVYSNLQSKTDSLIAKGLEIENLNREQIFSMKQSADAKLLLYFDVMQELKWEWKVQDSQLEKTAFSLLSNREKYYTNKQMPKCTENGDLIYIKQGLSDVLHFEKLDVQAKTHKIFTPGYLSDGNFDYKNGCLLWSELKSDIRWEHAETSVVISYNVDTKKRTQHLYEDFIFSPSFNHDASKIVAVEVNRQGNESLLIMNAKTGLVEQKMKADEHQHFQTPKFIDDKNVVFISMNREGKQLVKLNLTTRKKEILFASGYADMSCPFPNGEYIYFNASFTGIDNIFSLHLPSKKVYQVTASRFGARHPFVNSKQELYYSDYTSDGYLIAKTEHNKNNWKEWNNDFHQYPIAEELSKQSGKKIQSDLSKFEAFEVKKYSKFTNLFNLHSWAPLFIEGIERELDFGVSVAVQNHLNTLMSSIGYRKEEGFENGQFYANLSCRAWFPIFDTKLSVGSRNQTHFALAQNTESEQMDTLQVNTKWKQWEWESSIRFPLNLSSGQYSRKFIPTFSYQLVKFSNPTSTALANKGKNNVGKYQFSNESFTQEMAEYQFLAYNIAKSSVRDVQYQWAQIFEFSYAHSPFGDRDLGNTWSAQATLYFPGLFKHHGFKCDVAYQKRSQYNSLYSNTIKSPRGMSDLYGKHIASLRANYALPLFDPDWSLSFISYIKRLKMNSFVDYGYQNRQIEIGNHFFEQKNNYLSAGCELTGDMHLLRFSAPIEAGIRIGYENQSRQIFANFMISIDLNSY